MFTDSFPLLIKPASYSCNLRCSHCFYHPEMFNSPSKKENRMSEKTLQKLIKTYLDIPLERHVFIWQGGEPTLMGKHFFVQAVSLQNKYKKHGNIIENCLQTNGTLISRDFSKFLARNNFLVGLSIDGPGAMHDFYRVYSPNKGSYAKVMENFQTMVKDGVKINSLSLLSSNNVDHAVDIFYHLARKNILFQQYIPCVEFDESGAPRSWTVDPLKWGKALCALFDAWLAEKGRVSIRYFDALLYAFLTGKAGICHMDKHCGQYAVVEYNGDIFPCDFFVNEQWKLGNIHETPWPEVWEHPLYLAFRQSKSAYAKECAECEWLGICAGDCQKHRAAPEEGSAAKRSWLCDGYRMFFEYAAPILRKLTLPNSIDAQNR